MKHPILILPTILLTSLLFLYTGCDSRSTEEVSGLAKELVDKVASELPDSSDLSKLSHEEAEKILAMEYKIIDFTVSPSGAELENQLNSLGQNRWECLVASAVDVPTRIQCRRPARVFLRYALSRLF